MHHQRPAPAHSNGQSAATGASLGLPASVGTWSRVGEAQRVDPPGIFDYMDGAGELYLAYRFDHLDVIEYRAAAAGDILVELYWMRSSDDAFGLLSGDWGGEPVLLAPAATPAGGEGAAAWPRALYGAGLLRLWSDNLYARVMASQESGASREAVMALGRAIVAGRSTPPTPRLVAALPAGVGSRFEQRRESACFLRSHLVLNSAYFLSQQNILDLNSEVEAVAARYDETTKSEKPSRVRLVLVRYPDGERARHALSHFRAAYLPESSSDQGAAEGSLIKIEDGWAGYRRQGRCLALALDCPELEVAAAFVQAGLQALGGEEECHD